MRAKWNFDSLLSTRLNAPLTALSTTEGLQNTNWKRIALKQGSRSSKIRKPTSPYGQFCVSTNFSLHDALRVSLRSIPFTQPNLKSTPESDFALLVITRWVFEKPVLENSPCCPKALYIEKSQVFDCLD
jgi:hypothetical protein